MPESPSIKTCDLYPDVPVRFIGPDLFAGPLPAVFYFALAAHESLGVDPYNQPAAYLAALPVRVFSIDLPGHDGQGPHLASKEAMTYWAEQFKLGNDVVATCAELAADIIADLVAKGIILKDHCAVAGLSRGALIAAHVAARSKEVGWLLGFAPLTKIYSDRSDCGRSIHEKVDMERLTPKLLDKAVRFYIGNCDQRVGTRNCFDVVEKLSNAMAEAQIRSPKVELFISPSIGFQGHGTAPHIFHHGARWLAEELGAIDVVR